MGVAVGTVCIAGVGSFVVVATTIVCSYMGPRMYIGR